MEVFHIRQPEMEISVDSAGNRRGSIHASSNQVYQATLFLHQDSTPIMPSQAAFPLLWPESLMVGGPGRGIRHLTPFTGLLAVDALAVH